MTDDVRDQIITELADSEYRLARDLAVHRELLHLNIGQMHERECELERLRETHNRLRAEYRQAREALFPDGRKAARRESRPRPRPGTSPIQAVNGNTNDNSNPNTNPSTNININTNINTNTKDNVRTKTKGGHRWICDNI